MKYIFFGTPEFAAIILERLIGAGFIPAAVVTNPDRPAGRKMVLTAPAIKKKIKDLKSKIKEIESVEILQPDKLDNDFVELKKHQPEFGILAAYGKIIPKEIIDVFPKGIIVVHPSLLPKYRGATPIQSAILAGEKTTGTTLILMDEKVDHGKIISKSKTQISNNDNYDSLSKKLAELSANLLIETLPKYLAGEIKPQPQDHSRATYTKKFTTEDGFVDLNKNAPEIVWRKVRALNPEPGVYTLKDDKRMKILEADLVGGKLVLKKVQFEGKKSQALF